MLLWNGIYNTQNSQKMLCMRIYILNPVARECQITNKVNNEDNANINLKKIHSKQIDVYCSLLEGKLHQSLVKPGKIYFYMIQSKLNRTKQKQGVNMMHTNVTFDMAFAALQSNSSSLLFLEKLFFRNNSAKQNKLEG